MKKKTQAYEYHFVANESSASSRDVYEVKIRVDNRIEDPLARARAASLSCNCRGWIFSQDDPKSCLHTRRHAGALQRFITDEERRLQRDPSASSGRDQAEPWLPDLRAARQIGETEAVQVRDYGNRLLLHWGKGAGHIALLQDEGEIARVRRALKRPGESNFAPFDAEEWREAHPIRPRRLPWTPGLAAARQAWASSDEDDAWAEAVADFAWLGGEATEDDARLIDFGRVPKGIEQRRERFDALLGDRPPDEPVTIKWRPFGKLRAGDEHERTLSPAEFAARIGLGSQALDFFERLTRLCGAQAHWPGGGNYLAVRGAGCPYNLLDWQIDDEPILGFSLDAQRHVVCFSTSLEAWKRPAGRALFGDAYDECFQHLVHVAIDESEIRAGLDHCNEAGMNEEAGPEGVALFAVAAQFLLLAGFPGAAEMIAFERPYPLGQATLFSLPLAQVAGCLPDETAPDIWQLTGRGRLLLQSLLPLEAFAAARGAPTPEAVDIAGRCAAAARAACPGLPPTPALSQGGRAARRDLRGWLGEAREAIAGGADWLGPDCEQILGKE